MDGGWGGERFGRREGEGGRMEERERERERGRERKKVREGEICREVCMGCVRRPNAMILKCILGAVRRRRRLGEVSTNLTKIYLLKSVEKVISTIAHLCN